VEAWRYKFEIKINQKIKYNCDNAEHLLSELADTKVAIYCGHAGCDRNVDPLVSSHLILKNENLSVKEIMDRVSLYSPLDLVVLSGCETAMTANERHDDYMGLPAAFYCAGASNVIGSLWSVEDGATYVLMDKLSDTFAEKASWINRFIPNKIRNIVVHKDSKADALRNAALLLRHGLWGDEDRLAYFGVIQSIRAVSSPQEFAVTATDFIAAQSGTADINFDEWRHPYYWASFCCYGLG
jgi:CHAT domain-containing protein